MRALSTSISLTGLGLLKEGSESARPPSFALIPPTSQKVNSPRFISSMPHAELLWKAPGPGLDQFAMVWRPQYPVAVHRDSLSW
jgi:hypothetical protein